MSIAANLAIQSYDRARIAAKPAPPERSEAGFGAALGNFATGLHQADLAARSTMISGADPHALVEALAATELAVETAVSVRDKVVEAYLEILRMPV